MNDVFSLMHNLKYKFIIETHRTPTFFLCGLDVRAKLCEAYPEFVLAGGSTGYMQIFDLPVLEVLPPYPKDKIQVV